MKKGKKIMETIGGDKRRKKKKEEETLVSMFRRRSPSPPQTNKQTNKHSNNSPFAQSAGVNVNVFGRRTGSKPGIGVRGPKA